MRRPAVVFAVLLAAALTVAGCSSSAGSGAKSDRSVSGAKAPAGPAAGGDSAGAPSAGSTTAATTGNAPGAKAPAPATYLVRTAELSVRTKEVRKQLDAARAYAAQAGGYAGDEDTTVDARGHASSSIQLRVPPAAYDRVLTELAGLGQLLGRQVSVEDVTGQVVDVQSRITSQQASVNRVRALMDRADQLSDVVSLESELSTRESALEALEAQQASLRSRTNLATITLRLTEPPVPPRTAPPRADKHDGFWTSVGHALGDGWHAFYETVRVVLVVVSVALPFVLVALLGWFGYRLLRRRLPGLPRRTAAESSLRGPGGRPARTPQPAGQSAGQSAGIPLPQHPPESVPEPERPAGE